jgi:hypothetical protein
LQIQVFWSMTLCFWVNGARYYKGSQCLHLQESAVLLLDCPTLKIKEIQPFEKSRTSPPMPQCQIAEDIRQ